MALPAYGTPAVARGAGEVREVLLMVREVLVVLREVLLVVSEVREVLVVSEMREVLLVVAEVREGRRVWVARDPQGQGEMGRDGAVDGIMGRKTSASV